MSERDPQLEARRLSEETREIAESILSASWNGGEIPVGPSIPESYQLWVGYGKRIAREYLALAQRVEDAERVVRAYAKFDAFIVAISDARRDDYRELEAARQALRQEEP